MQGFPQKGNEEHINDREPYQAPDQNPAECRSFSQTVYHFRIRKPFTGCTAKYPLKKSIVHKQDAEKEPPEIIVPVSPIHYIPVPTLETVVSNNEYNNCVYKEIQGPGTVADCFHGAKIVSGA